MNAPPPLTPPTWREVPAGELDVRTLHDVLKLRSAVFVVEQDCAYQDVDGQDLLEGTVHLLAETEIGSGAGLAAYARVLGPDAEHDAPRIGRVIVTGAARGQQLGRRLVERALEVCAREHPGRAVELGGQAHLVPFYASLGFEPVGEVYDEDGIAHQWMRRPVG
ncbi:ElaA protein [Nocardioides scoriae]|uniref:ElaA protein n=1 Tax=Nocardioides scoriae TaxID=642780 RepID=A0A1H1VQN4_9ACTN|nr:GNAT family N-acetyltransferase [Nocardioides scoriae]SDS86741.1 ElaA protein [Nocardioides scoriae]